MWPFKRKEPVQATETIESEFNHLTQTIFKDLTGQKFPGGFGHTHLYRVDYFELRAKSNQLFHDNLYARGIIRRLITNEISTGLNLSVNPEETIIGLPDESLDDWAENVEIRFNLWAQTASVCDFREQDTFATIQQLIRLEALVGGDCLVILRQRPGINVPMVQIIEGWRVKTPLDRPPLPEGQRIEHGVRVDENGRHLSFFVKQREGDIVEVPTVDSTGRKIAWLVYGTDKRIHQVRGLPLLAIILYSLKELDRYRDSAQRKATINSLLALFITRDSDKPASKGLSSHMVTNKQKTVSDDNGQERQYKIGESLPGLALEQLQEGEDIKAHGANGTDVNYPPFEQAILCAIAWANEIPSEILMQKFSSNYSASQACTNEFKLYLDKFHLSFGDTVCTPIYTDWLISEVLNGKIQANGLLEAWRDPNQYDVFAAWVSSQWTGPIKQSLDLVKQSTGFGMMVDRGWTTNSKVARRVDGSKYTKNLKQLKKEREKQVEAARPLADFINDVGREAAEKALLINDVDVTELMRVNDDG